METNEMTRAEQSEEAAIIIAALELALKTLNGRLNRKGITEDFREILEEDIVDTQKVLDKYNDIYDDVTGPTIEQLEDLLIESGGLTKEYVEADRIQRGAIRSMLNNPTPSLS